MSGDREPSAEPDRVISGDRVYLGPLDRRYITTYRSWINDLRVSSSLATISTLTLPLTDEDEADWFESIRNDRSVSTFGIYELESAMPVGNISLMNIDHQNGCAELGLLIGERTRWGRGYATEACRLILDFGFTLLGLRSIRLNCVAYNTRALSLYERVGFRRAGVFRQAWKIGVHYHDVILMDMLASEFESPVLARMLADRYDIPASEGEAE